MAAVQAMRESIILTRLPVDDLLKPFEEAEGFEPGWWGGLSYNSDGNTLFFSARRGLVEIARAEVDTDTRVSELFDAPQPAEGFVEFVFFEVAENLRRQRIGQAVVSLIADQYPGRALAAFSEEADEFWASLGWRRYEHRDGTSLNRPLYLKMP